MLAMRGIGVAQPISFNILNFPKTHYDEGSGGLSASQVDMELLVSNFLQYKAIRKKADLGKKCFSEGRFLQVLYAFSHVKTELATALN